MEDVRFKEWTVARQTISEFDGRLHDLWKYGFSFLTALLAAESILIPAPVAESMGEIYLPNLVKMGVLLVTLVLILAIGLIDRNYQLFIKALVQRALILERALNIELTETISIRYKGAKVQWFREMLYVLFAGGIVILGYAILWPDYLFYWVVLAAIGVALAIVAMMNRLDLHYPHHDQMIDWSLDRNQCRQGDDVAIVITNLNTAKESLPAGTLFEIKSLDGKTYHTRTLEAQVDIASEGDYTSIWETKSVPPGTYQVFPDSWGQPLRRKITVLPKEPPSANKCPAAKAE